MNSYPRSSWAVASGAVVLLVAGCTSAGSSPPVATPSPTAGTEAAVPLGVHWVRTSAEHRMVYEQVYRSAAEHVAAGVSRGGIDGEWAVIMDADETVLDNSLYQVRRARQGLEYSPESWAEWVREEAAPVLPGAQAFMRRVKSLGGHIAIVTNRDEALCDATRRNLAAVGLGVSVVLCRQPGVSEKETRFRAVQDGTTPGGLPPLHVVAWIGDNIGDFPGGDQSLRQAGVARLEGFGTRYFVLPNPMYGSWTSNPGG